MVSSEDVSELTRPLMAAIDALDLPDSVRGTASELLRTVAEDVSISTHSHGADNVAAAALLLACRNEGVAVTLTEVVEAWSPVYPDPEVGQEFSKSSVGRAYNHFSRVLDVETSIVTPEQVVSRLADELGLPEEPVTVAETVLDAVAEVDAAAVGSVQPNGAAAAALYLACQVTGRSYSQAALAGAANTSAVTLRSRRDDFVACLATHPDLDLGPDTDFETVDPAVFLDLSTEERATGAGEGATESEADYLPEATVLFGDVRNFTSIVQLYEGSYETLDELFERIEARITDEHGGSVDKLLGDGVMAVWEGPDAARRAVDCAVDILESDVAEVRQRAPFELDMGFGIASGDLRQVNIGGVDRTVFGEDVNIAARLEGLCKRYDSHVVVDRLTYERVQEDVAMYRLPSRDIRGVTDERTVYVHPTADVDRAAVDRFNQAVADLDEGFYSEALEFFASAYGDRDGPYNRTLVELLAVECFDRFERDGDRYDTDAFPGTYTTARAEGAAHLRSRIGDWLSDRTDPARVLEIGCGGGEVLSDLASAHPSHEFVGIDQSPDAIADRDGSAPDNVSFRRVSPDRFTPSATFDAVYLDTPLYSVAEYPDAVRTVRPHVAPDGRLFVQQETEGFGGKFREVALETAGKLGYWNLFERFDYPVEFFDGTQVAEVLEERGWEPTVRTTELSIDEQALLEDFVERGLQPFVAQFSNAVEKQKFTTTFETEARHVLDQLSPCVYSVTATPTS